MPMHTQNMIASLKKAQELLRDLYEQGLVQPGDSKEDFCLWIKSTFKKLGQRVKDMDDIFFESIDDSSFNIDTATLSYYNCMKGLLLTALDDVASTIRAGVKAGTLSQNDALELIGILAEDKSSL